MAYHQYFPTPHETKTKAMAKDEGEERLIVTSIEETAADLFVPYMNWDIVDQISRRIASCDDRFIGRVVAQIAGAVSKIPDVDKDDVATWIPSATSVLIKGRGRLAENSRPDPAQARLVPGDFNPFTAFAGEFRKRMHQPRRAGPGPTSDFEL